MLVPDPVDGLPLDALPEGVFPEAAVPEVELVVDGVGCTVTVVTSTLGAAILVVVVYVVVLPNASLVTT